MKSVTVYNEQFKREENVFQGTMEECIEQAKKITNRVAKREGLYKGFLKFYGSFVLCNDHVGSKRKFYRFDLKTN